MPSTRRQKAKSRRSRDADMLSDYENMDIVLGSNNSENQDVEMDSFINGSVNRERDNVEANGENPSLDNEIRDIPSSSNSFQQDLLFRNLENITGQISQRFSREIESLVGTMNSRINDAIETAILKECCQGFRTLLVRL